MSLLLFRVAATLVSLPAKSSALKRVRGIGVRFYASLVKEARRGGKEDGSHVERRGLAGKRNATQHLTIIIAARTKKETNNALFHLPSQSTTLAFARFGLDSLDLMFFEKRKRGFQSQVDLRRYGGFSALMREEPIGCICNGRKVISAECRRTCQRRGTGRHFSQKEWESLIDPFCHLSKTSWDV
ncbi:hypothetical protein VNO78_33845 [Psophocarpus tetragonolobus]|uniref:Secreted protein n=1 Tax=Psophocarpus tetragonolobus TaxID=3891 RepID=A0AAN9RQE5_PSOTE